jgi:hypothetical protein
MEIENSGVRRQELLEMASRLDDVQRLKNDGRGIQCVVDVIAFLKIGDFEQAKRIANHDHDKIGAYPDIEELMERYGLCESYTTTAKRFKTAVRKDE